MLLEIPLGNGKFTWSREGASVAISVLDRFFTNRACDDEFETQELLGKLVYSQTTYPFCLRPDHLLGGPPSSDHATTSVIWQLKEHGLTVVLKAGQILYLVTS